jgi:hypothetical protein
MSSLFGLSSVLINTDKNGTPLVVGCITEATVGELSTQTWTLLAGFDPLVTEKMTFSNADPGDIMRVNDLALCFGKTVVTSFSQDIVDSPTGTDKEIEADWATLAARIIDAQCPNPPGPHHIASQVTIRQISPNFKPAPDQNTTKPWLKVIPFDYRDRSFTAEVWFTAGISVGPGQSLEIQACASCAPPYGPGRYTLIVAPSQPHRPTVAIPDPAPPA